MALKFARRWPLELDKEKRKRPFSAVRIGGLPHEI
jgi:hypothetical protein